MKRIVIGSLLVLGALGLVGCSATNQSSAEAPIPMDAVAPAPATEFGGEPLTEAATSADREIVVTGSITLRVDDPAEVAEDAGEIVETAGGRVDGRSESGSGDDGGRRATVTVRIPTGKVDATVDELRNLGEVESISIDEQDVTAVTQDLDARITALQTSVGRLLDLMSRATTTGDLIAIETSLAERQGTLEALEAQRRALADQVEMSTITLTLQSTAVAPSVAPGDFLGGLSAGWNSFVAFLSGLLVVAGVLLPWLAFLSVLTFGVLFLIRVVLRRRSGRRSAPTDSAS
jgi:hypothetical protein